MDFPERFPGETHAGEGTGDGKMTGALINTAAIIAGAMNYMLHHDLLPGGGTMLLVACLALGGLIGEILNIEHWFERFGEWLKQKTGNAKDKDFVNGFVTASLTVCIGAMAIVGSIQDGISGDWSTPGAKAILDFIIVMVMTSSLGKGCVFSAILY